MSESIFSRLFIYRGREKMSPRENFLTEMFAWMIGNLKQFGHDYVEFLMTKCEGKVNPEAINLYEISVDTQVNVKYENKNRYIDMVIQTDGDIGFICEHKVDSGVGENQIREYASCQEQLDGSLTYKTVLLTKSTEQHKQDQDANVKIVWHDIYEYFTEKNKDEYYNAEEKIIIDQFLMYLTEEGMGKKEAINANAVAYYCAAMKLETLLKSIFRDICEPEYWKTECEDINKFVSSYDPFVHRGRWGRIGIDFSTAWEPMPNVFAGVVLDNDDHQLKDFNNMPQLVVILDCRNIEDKRKFQEESWFESIKKDAQQCESESDFQIEVEPDKEWRLLILKKPLKNVLKGNQYEEQKKEIMSALCKGINWILKHYNEATKSN